MGPAYFAQNLMGNSAVIILLNKNEVKSSFMNKTEKSLNFAISSMVCLIMLQKSKKGCFSMLFLITVITVIRFYIKIIFFNSLNVTIRFLINV